MSEVLLDPPTWFWAGASALISAIFLLLFRRRVVRHPRGKFVIACGLLPITLAWATIFGIIANDFGLAGFRTWIAEFTWQPAVGFAIWAGSGVASSLLTARSLARRFAHRDLPETFE